MSLEIDPLADLTKEARRLPKDSNLHIQVVSVLHEGNVDDKLDSLFSAAPFVTLELPSISVNAFIRKEPNNLSSFWKDILSRVKRGSGVNNNAAAIQGRRLVTGQWPAGSRAGGKVPALVVSANSESVGHLIGQESVNLEKPRRMAISAPRVIEKIRRCLDSQTELPFSWDDEFGIYHLLKTPDVDHLNQTEALIAAEPWQSPMKFLYEEHQEIFQGLPETPYSFALLEQAVQHLIRIHIDKTQVKGILDQSIRATENKHTLVVHIGGIDHSLNIIHMLELVLGDHPKVTIEDVTDPRIVRPALTMRDFFARYIPPTEALLSTRIFEDFLFINEKIAAEVIHKALINGSEDLDALCCRQACLQVYKPDEVNFDQLVIEYLLSLLPKEVLAEKQAILADLMGQPIGNLVRFTREVMSEYSAEIQHAEELFRLRTVNFPKLDSSLVS